MAKKVSVVYDDYGKLPPQSVAMEEAVLGAIMLEKECLEVVVEILHPLAFYKENHVYIYGAIIRLWNRNDPIDILTVTNELKKSGELENAGGAYYITQLTNRVASSANVEYHARVVAQMFIKRETIRIGSEMIKQAYSDETDCFDITDSALGNLMMLNETTTKTGKAERHISEVGNEAIKRAEARSKEPNGVFGITSGLRDLDRVTGGWQPGDLIIIAARPSMGKTSLVLNCAEAAAASSKKVGFLSLEMADLQLVDRIIIAHSGVPPDNYRSGRLGNGELQAIKETQKYLDTLGIYIDDTPSLAITEIRTRARRMVRKYGIDELIVDYLQLAQGIKDKNTNREQEVATISRGLKAIAKELNIPVIALSQLSRQNESRQDKRPLLSDLRDSGAVEQDADLVLFIHRAEYYGIFSNDDGSSTVGQADLIIAKHRQGDTGTVKTKFDGATTKFSNIDKISKPFGQPVNNFYDADTNKEEPAF